MPPRRAPRKNSPRGEDEDVQGDGTNAMEQFFQRFSTSMVLEISYDRAYKNGARAFSHAVEPLDTHNWVETIEKMFIQLDLSRGMGDAANHMSWDQFIALFRERYISHSHVNRMREEFLNLKKSDDMTVMAFEQRFQELSYYVPDLVNTEQEKIYQFTKVVGGIYSARMIAVPYQSFHQAVTFAINIKAHELAAGRLRDSGGHSQGSECRTQEFYFAPPRDPIPARDEAGLGAGRDRPTFLRDRARTGNSTFGPVFASKKVGPGESPARQKPGPVWPGFKLVLPSSRGREERRQSPLLPRRAAAGIASSSAFSATTAASPICEKTQNSPRCAKDVRRLRLDSRGVQATGVVQRRGGAEGKGGGWRAEVSRGAVSHCLCFVS
ncbi:hypothetical protein ACLB2K_073644 [Fragaria x ananassa]